MIIESQPYGLHPRDIDLIIHALGKGEVGIVPTDSVYAFCCRSDQKSAFERICSLKRIEPNNATMSIICKDLSQASDYFLQWPTPVFRILNKNLPGPFTFILESGHRAPSFLKNKRRTLGLRIPQHPVIKSIMSGMVIPLLVSSVKDDKAEYFTEPEELIDRYNKQVGFIVVDDTGVQEESTVVDLTGDEAVVVRQSVYQLKL